MPWLRSGAILVAAGAASAVCITLIYKNRKQIMGYLNQKQESIAEKSAPLPVKKTKKKVLILGMEGAGKSTVLKDLASAAVDGGLEGPAVPTQGFKVMHIQKEDATYDLWEVGGSEPYRKYWDHFYSDTDLLVFIIDSSPNRKELEDAYTLLHSLLKEPKLLGISLLVVANKQDLLGALTALEIANELSIDPTIRRFQILGCSNEVNAHAKMHRLMFQMCDE